MLTSNYNIWSEISSLWKVFYEYAHTPTTYNVCNIICHHRYYSCLFLHSLSLSLNIGSWELVTMWKNGDHTLLMSVFGCHNKDHRLGDLSFIFLQFWKLEAQNQGASRLGWFFSKTSFPGLQTTTFSLWAFLCSSTLLMSLSLLVRKPVLWDWYRTTISSYNLNCLLEGLVSNASHSGG